MFEIVKFKNIERLNLFRYHCRYLRARFFSVDPQVDAICGASILLGFCWSLLPVMLELVDFFIYDVSPVTLSKNVFVDDGVVDTIPQIIADLCCSVEKVLFCQIVERHVMSTGLKRGARFRPALNRRRYTHGANILRQLKYQTHSNCYERETELNYEYQWKRRRLVYISIRPSEPRPWSFSF